MNRRYDDEAEELLLEKVGLVVEKLDRACNELSKKRFLKVPGYVKSLSADG